MTQLQEENMTVNVKVESANRGGLLVKYGPYEGFIPVSQFGPVSSLWARSKSCHPMYPELLVH